MKYSDVRPGQVLINTVGKMKNHRYVFQHVRKVKVLDIFDHEDVKVEILEVDPHSDWDMAQNLLMSSSLKYFEPFNSIDNYEIF